MGKVSKALNKVESSFKPDKTSTLPFHVPEKIHSTSSPKAKEKRKLKIASFSPQIIDPTNNWDERLVDATKRFSGVAESFRKLRTKILHPESGSPARSIMILSSEPQEGKSFICANLGVSFANSVEQNALMVNCDLRRPSLQNLFGVNNQNGLVNYLCDGENITNIIFKTGLPKLSIIPSGPPPKNPSELLSSVKMSAMIAELTNRYDDRVIILDSPPFHAASETLVLSQLVDKIVLVVRWGKSGRESVQKMLELIGRDKIIGVVFNAFEMNILDRKIQGVGYNNYYSDSYY